MAIPPMLSGWFFMTAKTRLPIVTKCEGGSRSLGAMGNGVPAYGFSQWSGSVARGRQPFARMGKAGRETCRGESLFPSLIHQTRVQKRW